MGPLGSTSGGWGQKPLWCRRSRVFQTTAVQSNVQLPGRTRTNGGFIHDAELAGMSLNDPGVNSWLFYRTKAQSSDSPKTSRQVEKVIFRASFVRVPLLHIPRPPLIAWPLQQYLQIQDQESKLATGVLYYCWATAAYAIVSLLSSLTECC